MSKTFCDVCGNQVGTTSRCIEWIDGGEQKFQIEVVFTLKGSMPDLCSECEVRLIQSLLSKLSLKIK